MGPLTPTAAGGESDLVFDDVDGVGGHCGAGALGEQQGHGQCHAFAFMRKFAAVVTECIGSVEIWVFGKQVGLVSRYDQVTFGSQGNVLGNSERDSGGELP